MAGVTGHPLVAEQVERLTEPGSPQDSDAVYGVFSNWRKTGRIGARLVTAVSAPFSDQTPRTYAAHDGEVEASPVAFIFV